MRCEEPSNRDCITHGYYRGEYHYHLLNGFFGNYHKECWESGDCPYPDSTRVPDHTRDPSLSPNFSKKKNSVSHKKLIETIKDINKSIEEIKGIESNKAITKTTNSKFSEEELIERFCKKNKCQVLNTTEKSGYRKRGFIFWKTFYRDVPCKKIYYKGNFVVDLYDLPYPYYGVCYGHPDGLYLGGDFCNHFTVVKSLSITELEMRLIQAGEKIKSINKSIKNHHKKLGRYI